MENIVLSNGMLTVAVSPVGAQLMSIRDRDGAERLYQGDSPFWSGRAPVLFPLAGGLCGDRYTFGGNTYEMPKHGFVRNRLFHAEHVSGASVTLVHTDPHPGFPFDYAFRVRFTLEENALRVSYITDNTGGEPFCFCVGAHEAYCTPGGVSCCEVAFERDEPLYAYRVEGSLLSHEQDLIPTQNGVLSLRDDHFAVDALVFPRLLSRSVTLRDRGDSRAVRVDFAGHDCLLLWTRPGAPFLCIEPWTNAPDFVDSDGCLEHKPGAIRLESGQRDIREHLITIL